jgi:branched-chain amino acid transport system substrate-binding protein
MRRVITLGCLAVLAALLGSCGDSATGGESEGPIRIGVIAPLSGPQPDRGKVLQTAAELAIDDVNEEGGVDGRQLEMVLLDDANITNQAVSAAQRLIRNEKVVAITGIISSSSQQAIQPLAERSETVVMGMIATATGLTDGFRYAFRATGSNDTIGPQIVEFAARNGAKRLAVIHDDSTYAQGMTDEALAAIEDQGLELTANEVYKTGAADVSPQVANVERSGADAVLAFPLTGADIALLTRTMTENGVDLPIFSHNGVFTKEAISLAGKYFKRLPAVYGSGTVDLSRPDTKSFYERMTEAAGFEVPQNEDAAQTYDAIRLLAEALKQTGGQGGSDLVAALEKIDRHVGIAGSQGTYYSFGPDNHTGLSGDYMTMYRFEGDGFVVAN